MSGLAWKLFRKCSNSTATLGGPLERHVRAFEATGEDLTVAVRNEFLCTQKALVNYRIAKFYQELAAARLGGGMSLATLGVKDAVYCTRTVVRLVFFFMLGVMIGRRSMFPLLHPSSPFVEGLKYQNPNYVDSMYAEKVLANQ